MEPVCVTTRDYGGPNFVTLTVVTRWRRTCIALTTIRARAPTTGIAPLSRRPSQPPSQRVWRAFHQCSVAAFQRHQVAEHLVVLRWLVDRAHPLQPGLDGRDVPADGACLHLRQNRVRVPGVGLSVGPRRAQRLHRELGDEAASPVIGRGAAEPLRPFPAAAGCAGTAASGDQLEHRGVHRRDEGGSPERIEDRPAERGALHAELERFALHLDHGITRIVALVLVALACLPGQAGRVRPCLAVPRVAAGGPVLPWPALSWAAWRAPALRSAALHSPALHSPALHSPALHSPALHSPALAGSAWPGRRPGMRADPVQH